MVAILPAIDVPKPVVTNQTKIWDTQAISGQSPRPWQAKDVFARQIAYEPINLATTRLSLTKDGIQVQPEWLYPFLPQDFALTSNIPVPLSLQSSAAQQQAEIRFYQQVSNIAQQTNQTASTFLQQHPQWQGIKAALSQNPYVLKIESGFMPGLVSTVYQALYNNPLPTETLEGKRYQGNINSYYVLSLPILNTGFKFAALGDTGTGSKHQYRVADTLHQYSLAFPLDEVLLLGDMLYDNGSQKRRWNDPDPEHPGKTFGQTLFKDVYTDLLPDGRLPRVVVGNHDVKFSDDAIVDNPFTSKQQETPYRTNHTMKAFYGFDDKWYNQKTYANGKVNIFALDTCKNQFMGNTPEAEQQRQWLKRELLSSNARWNIVFAHNTMFDDTLKHSDNTPYDDMLRNIFMSDPVLSQKTSVFLAGHDHRYGRQQWSKNQSAQNMPEAMPFLHITSGGGGGIILGPETIHDPSSRLSLSQHHFMLFSIVGEHLFGYAIDENGQLMDSFSSIPIDALYELTHTLAQQPLKSLI